MLLFQDNKGTNACSRVSGEHGTHKNNILGAGDMKRWNKPIYFMETREQTIKTFVVSILRVSARHVFSVHMFLTVYLPNIFALLLKWVK